MQSLKWLFNKETRHGRGLRTGLQALVALLTFIAGLVAIPGLADVLIQNDLTTAASFATWAGLIAYLQNTLEDLLAGLGE